MMAHKVDGENLVTYSEFHPADWKLERWTEAKDSLLLKTTTTRGSNVTHSLCQGILFSIQKIEG